ncbi:MAG: alpha-D-QuiNAc alpha,3-galactosyltransferase [Alphaproteobacteria bacterium]|jgi:glycosyltransferase involved in cell wall biosynthesis|nr:alpha-D-QuiNAc alpha,3-galactosyltransferase [Alphaproteobacteria bacterium]MDF3033404.1 alpha-D-QuiNAc alpha,3-galactosyltransferase [Alphaproteobacteria bacterium]
MSEQTKKLVFLVTELGYFCSHRLNLALAAKQAGFEITVVTNCTQRPNSPAIEAQLNGFSLYHLPFHRSRLNPIAEVQTLWQLWRAYRRLRPDIVHQVALKPVIYGTLCARLARVPRIVNALGGMGYLFTHRSVRSTIIKPLMALAFRILLTHRRCALILQNPDDVELMTPLVGRDKIQLIRGSGIDLNTFYPTEEPPSPPVKAVMVSRLLWSKGIGELVEAASLLKQEGVPLEIQVAGDLDPQNPASVSPETLSAWKEENGVIWLGARTDIAEVYHQAHIAVLPSYREGLPKSLLEAAACGKPIVTTDVPGCREVVISGENGLLVPPRNGIALAKALRTLVEYPELRVRMGKLSRRKAEQEFDEKKVIEQTLAIYHEKR